MEANSLSATPESLRCRWLVSSDRTSGLRLLSMFPAVMVLVVIVAVVFEEEDLTCESYGIRRTTFRTSLFFLQLPLSTFHISLPLSLSSLSEIQPPALRAQLFEFPAVLSPARISAQSVRYSPFTSISDLLCSASRRFSCFSFSFLAFANLSICAVMPRCRRRSCSRFAHSVLTFLKC